MNRSLRFYTLEWSVLFIIFNILSFTVPTFPIGVKYTYDFFISYGVITFMLVAQLICAILVLNKGNDLKSIGQLPLAYALMTVLGVSALIGMACVLIAPIHFAVDIIICVLVLVLCIEASLYAYGIIRVDKRVREKTEFIKVLTSKCEALAARATSETGRRELHKVHDAIRYADPMSDASVYATEKDIEDRFEEFSAALRENDEEKMKEISFEICALIAERNSAIKLLK